MGRYSESCEAAIQKATTAAVRKIYGEKVSVTEQLSCKEEGSERIIRTVCIFLLEHNRWGNSFLEVNLEGNESIDSLSNAP